MEEGFYIGERKGQQILVTAWEKGASLGAGEGVGEAGSPFSGLVRVWEKQGALTQGW